MIRKRVRELAAAEGDTAAFDVYDDRGRLLVKRGARITFALIAKLEVYGIPFIYVPDENITARNPFGPGDIAELLKILTCFTESGGESSAILKRYPDEQINRFLSYNNDPGKKIAYIHIFRYFIAEMLKCLKAPVRYDFLDYRNRDTYLYFHLINVCCISLCVGKNMGMSDRDLAELALGAVLYDHKMKFFGMTDRIGPLDPVETEEMRGHTFFAYDALKKIYGFPSASALVSCQHHERFNGSGYPKGIKGESISVFSRITAAADVYDSMMSNRPYRDAFLPEDAWDHIVNNGDGIFDPVVVSVFEKTVGRFLPGDIVSREGDAAAVVAGNNFLEPERPEIKLIEKKVKSDIIACPNGEKIRTIESIR